MQAIEGTRLWFKHQQKDDKPSYWVLYKGKQATDKKIIHTNHEVSDFDESWELLEQMILSQYYNGVYSFVIKTKQSMNTPTGSLFEIKLPYNSSASGIGGVSPGRNNNNVSYQEIIQLNNQVWEQRLEALENRLLNTQKIKELEAENEAIKHQNISKIDKLIDALLPAAEQIGIGLAAQIGGAFMPNGQSGAAQLISGTPSTDKTNTEAKKNTMVNIDANRVLAAAQLLGSKFQNPESIIETLVNYAVANPQQATTFIQGLAQQQKQQQQEPNNGTESN